MLTFRPITLLAATALAAFVAYTASPSAPVPVDPTPGEIIEIVEGTPFTVPTGEAFVAIALGTMGSDHNVSLLINAVVDLNRNPSTQLTMVEIPKHYVIRSGSVITVFSGFGVGRCWGYLIVN